MNQFESVDKILVRTVTKDMRGLSEKFLQLSISQHWKEIAGNVFNQIAPLRVQNKTLFLYAKNSAVKNNVKYLSKDIIKKINEIVGYGEEVIEKISFGRSFEKPVESKKILSAFKTKEKVLKVDLSKIILTAEEIAECEKKSSGKAELTKIFIDRAKLRKWKLATGWNECRICGELCEPKEIICSICRIHEREKMKFQIGKIFSDKPNTAFYAVQEKIFESMPHMKGECTLEMIESVWASLIRETAARVSYGDKTSKSAKFLVMLFKQVEEKNLTDALIKRALHELRFNLADQPSYKDKVKSEK